MKIIKDSVTALDGESFAVAKVVGVLVVVVFLGLSIADFIENGMFDAQSFGIGAGAAVAAMGAAIKLSESSEPK